MDALKIAGEDIKNIFKNRVIRISIIAIIVVPVLYSLLYLKAFWDPYASLSSMPVAVVNLDKGSTMDGKSVNYGEDMVNELRESTDLGWKFTDEKDADKGLDGNEYYAKFVIPEDFSSKVISAKDGKPEEANLKFVSNEKKNFLAAQINSKVEGELKAKIVSTITKNYVTTSFDKLYEVKDGMITAADGSKKLADGVGTLNEKAPMLVDGVKMLDKGSNELRAGQEKLNQGVNKVSDGIGEVNKKVPALALGVNSLYNGSNDLKDGLSSAESGTGQLNDGGKKLYDAFSKSIYPSVNELKKGANQLNKALGAGTSSDTSQLGNAAKDLKVGSEKVSNSSKSLLGGYEKINNGVNEAISSFNSSSSIIASASADLQRAIESGDKKDIESALKKLQALNEKSKENSSKLETLKKESKNLGEGFKEYNNGVQNYTQGVTKYVDGTASLANGFSEIGKGVNKISSGLDALEKGLNENNSGSFGSGLKAISSNIGTLGAGINKLNVGAGKLNSGLYELNSNIPTLSSGINALDKGASELKDGSGKLLDGQDKLNSGIGEFSAKIPELKEGVEKLNDGSKELSEKLGEGADEITSGLKNSSDTMGDFVSSPVSIENAPTNPVPNYGTGFAPYFIPLSLWIGAIMMFFVISSKDNSPNSSKFSRVVGKFLSFGFVGVLQALLVAVVVLGLGLNPTSTPLYFALIIFFSIVFVAIVYCLISLLGDPGRLLSIVLLILQLTGCAGTFPLEVVPNFFKVINPYLPFTYAVEGLREVVSSTSINYAIVSKDVLILGAMLVVFLLISIVFKSAGERLQDSIEVRKNEKRRIEESMNLKTV